MAMPHEQRISELECDAFRTGRRTDSVEINLKLLHRKVDQHGVALSETMRDLRDLRIETTTRLNHIDGRLDGIDGRLDGVDTRLDGIDGRLDRHESLLAQLNHATGTHTTMLAALLKHFGINIPRPAEAQPAN